VGDPGRSASRIAITGATGFLGCALTRLLHHRGYAVVPVSRRSLPGGIPWDPARGALDPRDLEGIAAVINFAGENLATSRWTAARKQALADSRLQSTTLLARTMHDMPDPPRTLISVSGINYYGDRGDEVLDEAAPPGNDFLARLCVEWEGAAEPAAEVGIRVVHPRIGVVLDGGHGALQRMLPFFRLGLGGRVGSGTQWMSWIAIDDVLDALVHLLEHDDLDGPVNVVAPNAVRNAEFTRTLGRVLRRPAVLAVPGLALRVLYGEVADAVLIAGQHAIPARLAASGFAFRFADFEPALRHVLGR
jgi:uncharacterized protein